MHKWVKHETIETLYCCSVCGYLRLEMDRWGKEKRISASEIVYGAGKESMTRASESLVRRYDRWFEAHTDRAYVYSAAADSIEIDGIVCGRWDITHRQCPARSITDYY